MIFEELKTEMNDSILMQLKPSKTEIMKSKLYNQLNDLIPFEDAKTIVIDSIKKAETIEDFYIGILIGVYKLGLKNSQDDILTKQPETCEGCRHLGKWENEVEYGYPSPCTRCKRRVEDYYER